MRIYRKWKKQNLFKLFKPGDFVKVKDGVKPSHGWGYIVPGDIGVVMDVLPDGKLNIDFQSNWMDRNLR